jgi:general stress protein 26
MKNQESSSDVETLAKEINGIRIAMLVTTNRQGHMHARPMATQEMEFDGTLWFFTRDESPKAQEIENDSSVNVSYADPEGNRYVSIAGRASMVHDRAKMRDLWSPAVKAWFPDGVDDPKLALIRVDVISAQYWDFASRRLVQLAGFVKAVLTGQPLKTDQNNRKIDFSQH